MEITSIHLLIHEWILTAGTTASTKLVCSLWLYFCARGVQCLSTSIAQLDWVQDLRDNYDILSRNTCTGKSFFTDRHQHPVACR